MNYVLGLEEITMSDVDRVGGKAARLGDLMRAGFPVPGGFCVTNEAFEASGMSSLREKASRQGDGGELIDVVEIPPEVSQEITKRYESLGNRPVAVRSSAAAEDTQESSFAGQYESFLQVVGKEALLLAVRRCWVSLWAPRAIRYRERRPSHDSQPTMAVLIQTMVPARASGVMFTANPVTSDPDEIVIDANPGLGEVVVAGRVTPDTYILDKKKLKLRERVAGRKEEMMVADGERTRVVPVPEKQRRQFTLTRRQCMELGRLGRSIERHFDSPQDIEYVHDGERFWIVQSRPVTGLTSWPKPRKGTAWSRHSFIEFMPRPLSPLFATTYLPIMSDFLRKLAGGFGIAFRGREPVVVTINGYAFIRIDARISITGILKSPFNGLRYLANLWGHRWRRTLLEPYAQTVAKWKDLEIDKSPPKELWNGVKAICRANAEYWEACLQNRVSGMIEQAFTGIYPLLVRGKDRPRVFAFLRGHDSEPVRAEGELFQLVQEFREDVESTFREIPADRIVSRLQTIPRGREFLSRFQAYLDRNGHQISTLDFIDPTLAEQPEPLLERIKLFFAPERDTTPPHERARQERLSAEAQIEAGLGPIRRTLMSGLLSLLNYGLVLREDVLFFHGMGWPVARRFILELGRRIARDGLIESETDVFFLTETELETLFGGDPSLVDKHKLGSDIDERRKRREEQLRIKPPVLIPSNFGVFGFSMRPFMPEYSRPSIGRQIVGIPVSPGRATGPAAVIGSPEEFRSMKRGAILIAPLTTPAWTPLFALASGVVTDVGGLLSHASIVAREYGIPAVIGTGVATHRIQSGQLVTVDGDRGTVTLEDSR